MFHIWRADAEAAKDDGFITSSEAEWSPAD